MYLHTTKVKRANGRVDEYIRLVKACWNNGHPSHRIVYNLGRKDVLAPHADALLQILKGKTETHGALAIHTLDWGTMLAGRCIWQQIGAEAAIDADAEKYGEDRDAVDRLLALAIYHLAGPTRGFGFSYWLETTYVCDRLGIRWLPECGKTHGGNEAGNELRKWHQRIEKLIDLGRVTRVLSRRRPLQKKAYERALIPSRRKPDSHAVIALLAHSLDREVALRLKTAGTKTSSSEAWELLKTVRITIMAAGDGGQKRIVSCGHARAKEVLEFIGIYDPNPDFSSKKTAERPCSRPSLHRFRSL